MATALGDIRILDLSRVLAGPLATMVLADLGARVVKVERPGGGDDTRSWGPPYDAAGDATYFQAVNRNKESLIADLCDPVQCERIRALALTSDVIVENFRPGALAAFGLDHATLSAAEPGLVYCSVTGFGSTGPGADLPGYDLLVQAMGGLMSITGAPDGEPMKVGVALVDVICGLFAAIGILAAVRHRDRTGEGQLVEVDLLSSLLAALVNQGSAYTVAGVVGQRMGNAHPSVAPYEAIGDLILAVGNDGQFAALCRVIGTPELADDARFATNGARVGNREALRGQLATALAARPAAAWVGELNAAGVPAGSVNDVAGAFALARRLGLDPIVEVPRPDGTTVPLTRSPIRLSATPATYRLAPPRYPDGDDPLRKIVP
jgi:crotonobetainyl-CoA:carnitine CoA-transferase CaiB-like acyl-CoA transferase